MNSIFKELQAQADPEKAKQMSAYMKDQSAFLGIQTPKRRDICKPYWKERSKEKQIDWQFIDDC